jgi:hypothetical protein
MNFGRARHLSNVEGDEISPVRRAANKRRFLLMKGGDTVELDPEIADILSVPVANEGALLDMVRKDGADEVTEGAVTMAARLLAAIGPDLTRETVEKLGSQMYAQENRPLNTGHGMPGEPLNGSMVSGPNPSGGAAPGDYDDNDPADIEGDDDNFDTDSPADLAAVGKDKDNDGDDDDVEKRTFTADERKNLASRGQAESDGSYPIANKGDLKNAIQAFGRSKNKGKTKSHIIARAKALGATSMLPDGWTVTKGTDGWGDYTLDAGITTTSSGSGTTVFINSTEGGDPVETHAVPIQKEDGTWDLSGVPSETRPFYESVLKQAEETKSELAATRERLEKSEEKAVILSDTLKTRELIQKAEHEYGKVGPAEDVAQVLKSAQESMDEETYEKFETILKAAQAKIDTGDLFTELGRAGTGAPLKASSAEAQAIQKADELVEKSTTGLTRDAAMGMVWEQNPGLYDRYLAENQQLWTSTPDPALAAAYAASQGGEQ